ncbi:amidase [Hirsutella rhossiliensis]|uniref:Amidase domain-containing protein n=1 Tax=Hirsutella rhossiliensis TaxID=111463 RepID=A0A9P8N694_9HYPO|nr:amidase domain-containing protein [Hirsutella rhossiliensis]KAH0966554.1 amidase domain-containing protein [Hirsutella rhossiliensis]
MVTTHENGACIPPDPQSSRAQGEQDASQANKLSKLHLCTATEIRELVYKERVTVQEYAQALIGRFNQRNHEVKAWAHYDKNTILAEAKRLDDLPPAARGPLHGVAVGIKDVLLTKDMPTRYNSRINEDDGNAAADADAVAILRTAGALILGKTATTEFAAKVEGGSCCNPRSLQHTPGGSSSGSAAAVGDNQVPIALGTQTGGSIIRPGAFNGLYAFKPTWGLVSTEGVGRFSTTCDTVGFFARTLDDLALLAKVYRLDFDYSQPPEPFSIQGASIAFVKTSVWDQAGSGTRKAWEKARSLLADAGAVIQDFDLPEPFQKCREWRETIVAGEARSAFLSKFVESQPKLHASLQALVQNKHDPSRRDMLEAYDGVARLRPQWDEIARRYDVVVTPSTVDDAPKGLWDTGSAVFNVVWTILHAPTLNVPGFFGEHGLPIGLTVVGPRYGDMQLLLAGKTIGELFERKGGI